MLSINLFVLRQERTGATTKGLVKPVDVGYEKRKDKLFTNA